MKILLLLAAIVVAVRADCDACIKGWCHYRETLIEGFMVTDQMAIDQTNDILYVQLNHNLNTAYHLREHKIRLVQTLNTTGMTVDQRTQTLYTAHGSSIFKITPDETVEKVLNNGNLEIKPQLLSYGDQLYYVNRNENHLGFIVDYFIRSNYDSRFITDTSSLVSLQNGDVYVSNNSTVYLYRKERYSEYSRYLTELKTFKNADLSNDKDNVYVTDASANVIYKISDTGVLDEYAAYETGSVGQIVFDSNGTVVFHDTASGSVNRWQRGLTPCKIEMLHKYIIKTRPLEIPEIAYLAAKMAITQVNTQFAR